MSPPISIIVPVYNLEFYVERCLRSLENQTLPGVEVLVVDDGSTDDSPMLIQEFVDRNPRRFRLIQKPNGGHGSACNEGIANATGEYVMFVDGDDFLDPDTSDFMYRKAVETGADLVMGNLKYIFSDHTDQHAPIAISTDRMLDASDRSALFDNWATPCARLYRRTMFDDPAVRFLPGIIFADVNFAPKSYLAAPRIYYVNRELYNYDLTRPTQSMKHTDQRVLNVIPALRDMLEFYRSKGEFARYEAELMSYTVRHCVAWIDKIKTLKGYPKDQAIREVFQVADDQFGDKWLAMLDKVATAKKAKWIRRARPLRYAPIFWSWVVAHRATRLDRKLQQQLGAPLRGYQAVSKRVLRRLTAF